MSSDDRFRPGGSGGFNQPDHAPLTGRSEVDPSRSTKTSGARISSDQSNSNDHASVHDDIKLSSGPSPTQRRSSRRIAWVGMAVIVVVSVFLTYLVTRDGPIVSAPPVPRMSDPIIPRAGDPIPPSPTDEPDDGGVPVAWEVQPSDLRPDISDVRFGSGLDGDLDTGYFLDFGTAIVTATDTDDHSSMMIHALDPESGDELWSHELPHGICADRQLGGFIACTSATSPMPAEPTSYDLQLIDPANGTVMASTPVQGSARGIAVVGDRIFIVEEWDPAPHAVVRVFDGDLSQIAVNDLSEQDNQSDLFSTSRIYNRSFNDETGPWLFRLRLRIVADDSLLAVWAGTSVAFIDTTTGELRSLQLCSQIVDDGTRLWCNQGDVARAYDYSLSELYATDPGIRLGHPKRDPRFGDVTQPVFVDTNGVVMSVDETSGATLSVLARPGVTDTWEGTAYATGMTVGTNTFTGNGTTTVLLNSDGSSAVWEQGNLPFDDFWAYGPYIAFGDFGVLTLFDPATGAVIEQYERAYGVVEGYGDGLYLCGLDSIRRLDLP